MKPTEIVRYHGLPRKHLLGMFEVLTDAGIIITDCSHYSKDGKEWINMPCKLVPNPNDNSKKYYLPFVKFPTPEEKIKFEKQTLALLNKHLDHHPEAEIPEMEHYKVEKEGKPAPDQSKLSEEDLPF